MKRLSYETEGLSYKSLDPRTAERKVSVQLSSIGEVHENIAPLLERIGKVPDGSKRQPRMFSVTVFSIDQTGTTGELMLSPTVIGEGNKSAPRNARQALENALGIARQQLEGDQFVKADVFVVPPKDVRLERKQRKSEVQSTGSNP